MQFRRAVLVVIFIALLGSAFLVSQPVQAQGTVDCSYPQFWDFKQGLPAGFTMTYGVLTPDGIGPELIDASTKRIELEWECTADVGAPRGFNFGFWSNSGWAGARPYDIYHYNAAGSVIYGPYGQGAGAAGYSLWGPISWSAGDTRQNTRRWKITYQWGTGQVFYFQSFDINNWEDWQGTPTPTPTLDPTPNNWSYPVALRDRPTAYESLYPRQSPFSIMSVADLSGGGPSPLLGLTNQPYQAVHAMVDGTITAISALGSGCINQGAFGGIAQNPVSASCIVYDPENDENLLYAFYLKSDVGYLVEQTITGDDKLYYVVQEVRVEVGDEVGQDCILGLSIPLRQGYPTIADPGYGWTMVVGVNQYNIPFDLAPRLSHEPDDISCNTEGWVYTVGTISRSVTRPHIYKVLPPFLELDKPDRSASLFVSSYGGSDVHAAVAGEITSVEPVGGTCINTMGVITSPGTCTVNDVADTLPLDYLHHLIWSNAYVVTQDVGDGRTVKYVLTHPRVAVGDEVSPSCILGQTGTMQRSDYSVVANSSEGWALVQGLDSGDESFDVAPLMAVEPTGVVCDGLAGVACALVRDPGFDDQFTVWQADTQDLSHFANGLVPEGRTWQSDLYLDPATEYAIMIRHRPEVGANGYSFSVTLGTEDPYPITYFPKDGNSPKDIIIPAQTYAANSSGTYTLSIEEISNPLDARVDFICIYDPDGDEEIPQPGGGCLLLNYEFDQDSAYWTPTGVTVFGGGLARVLDEGAIAQALKLSPKATGPQDYTLTVKARRAGVYAAGETIDLAWTWGGTFSGNLAEFTTTTGSNFQEKSATFTVSGAATNDLTLTVDADDSTAKSLHIDSVCVNTTDGVVPPGYLPPPVIEANCRICVYEPSGDIAQDLSELVAWLGCMLLSLWECSVKSVLVGIWNTLTAILVMFGYFRMWLSLSFSNFAEWANGSAVVFANYIGGEIWNLGTRIDNALTNTLSFVQVQGGGGAGLWDFLTALVTQLGATIGNVISGVIGPLIDLVREIAGGVLRLIAGMVDLIVALLGIIIALISGFVVNALGTVMGIFQAIINGINMAPAEIPTWLAACSDPLSGAFAPDSQIGYLCLGVYVMEQRLQQGAAQYFIPVFIGLASLALLLWGSQALLRAIASLGGGSDE